MTAIATPRHRVSVATAHVHAELDEVRDASVWSMDAAETAATLVALDRAEAKLAELKARVAAHADDLHLGHEVGASSAANWLAHRTKQTRAETNRAVRLGHDLDTHPATRDALAGGQLCVDQARVILRWVDEIPADLRARAEAHLLAAAEHLDAKALNMLGRRLYEVIDPDAADAHEAQLLAREEEAAAKACRLTMHDDGHGQCHGRFTLPTLHGAALRKMLAAITAPKHQHAVHGAGVERLATPEAMGNAFGELITRYPTKSLPTTGSLNATLLVMIDEDSLMGRVEKAGLLDTGERISPGLARRLACEAGIIPVVLGGHSQPLDLGRKRRLHTEAQRLAILIRDRGCRAEGCDRTASLHTHHTKQWAHGGETTVNSGVALCPWHHSRAHDTNYQTTYRPNGTVTFHRRT
jgi:hypothetical protein